MPQTSENAGKSIISYLTHIRRDILHIHPRDFFLAFLLFFAMNTPVYKLRLVFHKLRGAKIEKDVSFGPMVFLDERYPELITIKERADIGPRVIIITHDSILFHLDPAVHVVRTKEVIIGRNCYVGAGTIILPGVTIGDNSIIGAGSVVTKSIPPGSVAMGIPATIVSFRDEWNQKYLVNK